MKKILLFLTILTLHSNSHTAEAALLNTPWEEVDSFDMREQIEALTATQSIFKKALDGSSVDSVAAQEWAQKWQSLSLSTDPDKNWPGFMRGLNENYRKCNFDAPIPPFPLCLGYASLTDLEATDDPSSISRHIQKAHEAFEKGEKSEENLRILKAHLVPLYQRLTEAGNKPPFKDFGQGKRDWGKEEFENFFSSLENLQAAQARKGFRPLDRMGQMLRQSSIFTQDHHDFELAKAATKGSKAFNKAHSAHRLLWENTGITSEAMAKISKALEELRAANNPEETLQAAEVGLDLALAAQPDRKGRISQIASTSLELLSSALSRLAWQ